MNFTNELTGPVENLSSYFNCSVVHDIPVLYGAAMSFVGCFGTFFNLITIHIIRGVKPPLSFKIFLVTLTAMDAAFCVASIPKFFVAIRMLSDNLAFISYVISDFGRVGSTFFTVLLSIERYTVISNPIEYRNGWTRRKIGIVLILSIICVLMRNFPPWYFYLLCYKDVLTVDTVTSIITLETCLLIAELLSTTICVVALNCIIFAKIKKSLALRAKITHEAQNTATFTKITQLVVGCFLLLQTVPRVGGLVLFLQSIANEKLEPNPIDYYLHLLVALNSATNWIIYCAAARKLRIKYLQLFFGQKCQPRKTSIISMTTTFSEVK